MYCPEDLGICVKTEQRQHSPIRIEVPTDDLWAEGRATPL